MAVNGTHDYGEEWKQKNIFRQDTISTRNSSLTVGLYNDNSDSLGEASDVSDITSEPSSGEYAPQTLSLDSSDLSLSVDGSGNLQVEGTVTFQLLDTGATVDGYFITTSFQSDIVNSESSENEHIVISGTFGTEDLSQYSEIDVTIQDTLS
jgi:hypothetical protein